LEISSALEIHRMIRKIVLALIVLLWMGASALPIQAQSDGPTSQTPVPQMAVHIVQRGETLFSIARRYGVTVDSIAHTNGIPDPRQIYVGQRLVIPGDREDISTAATIPYIVQAGDTLASIARRHLTTWQTLTQVNALLSPNVVLPPSRSTVARPTSCVRMIRCCASRCAMAYPPGRWPRPAALRTRR